MMTHHKSSFSGNLERRENFLRQFRDINSKQLKKFTATQFAEVWNHYDNDGNGFIEGKELDQFLREFISSVCSDSTSTEVVSEAALKGMRQDFLTAFDENDDERIEIAEMAQILPTDENFYLLFRRDNPLKSSIEFMKVWKKYDKDRSGFIESNELEDFIRDLLLLAKKSEEFINQRINEYTINILNLFDLNRDGKLQLSEMARLLPIKENYLCRPIFKNANKISVSDIDKVFSLYDVDRNGFIENIELEGFLKDLLALAQEVYDDNDMGFFKNVILNTWDVNHDGKISNDELRMMLVQQSKLSHEEEIARKKIFAAKNSPNLCRKV